MKFIFVTLTILVSFVRLVFSQNDTTIYLAANNKPATKETAVMKIDIKKLTNGKFECKQEYNYDNTWVSTSTEMITLIDPLTLKLEITYSPSSKKETTRILEEFEGKYKFKDYDKNLQLLQEGITRTKFPLYLEGEVKSYYPNGVVSTIAIYEENQLKSNQRWLENGEKDIDNVFGTVDELPKYPDGDLELRKYIASNVVYPKDARKKNIQGKVFVGFVVDVTGDIIGIKVARGVHPLLDEAAVDVIKSMSAKWQPGMLDGKKVRVAYTIPVNFQLR